MSRRGRGSIGTLVSLLLLATFAGQHVFAPASAETPAPGFIVTEGTPLPLLPWGPHFLGQAPPSAGAPTVPSVDGSTLTRVEVDAGNLAVAFRVAASGAGQPAQFTTGGGFLPGNGPEVDALLFRFDAGGQLVFQASYTFGTYDFLYGVDVDEAGEAYATGVTGDGLDYRMLALRADASGALRWARILDFGPDRPAIASDAELDGSGRLVIAGGQLKKVVQADGSAYLMLEHVAVASLDPEGQIVWQRTYDVGMYPSFFMGLAITPGGSIVVAGWGVTAQFQHHLFVLQLSEEGEVEHLVEIPQGNIFPYGVASTRDDAVYVSGTVPNGEAVWLARLGPDRSVTWTRTFTPGTVSFGHDVATDALGNAHVAGSVAEPKGPGCCLLQEERMLVLKVTPTGDLGMAREIGSGDDGSGLAWGFGIALDATGSLVATSGVSGEDRLHRAFAAVGLDVGGPLPPLASGVTVGSIRAG